MQVGSILGALAPNRRSFRRSSRRVVPEDTRRCWLVLLGSFGVLGLVLVAYLVSLLVRPGDAYWTWLDGWVVCGVEFAGSLLCITKGVVRRPGRTATLALGIGLLAWAVGDAVLTSQSIGGATPPTPSLADAFYLTFYPLAYVAVVLFMRAEVKLLSPSKWLDGIIAGLGAAAVCGAFAFHGILRDSGSSPFGTVTNLAYPIGDLLLLSLVIGGCRGPPGPAPGPVDPPGERHHPERRR